MNGYAFIASIFQSIVSLAWPVAIVIIVWMLRRRIEELLPNLRAKYKDFEISLRLDRAEKEIAALPPPASAVAPDPGPTPEETDRFEQMASVSPRAAITEVRRDLEEALDRLVRQHGLVDRIRPMSATIHLLSSKGIIDPHTSSLLDDLRVMGNVAIHGGADREFSKQDAIRYRKLADGVLVRLAFTRVPDGSAGT